MPALAFPNVIEDRRDALAKNLVNGLSDFTRGVRESDDEQLFEVMDAELTSLLANLVERGLHWLIELLAPHLRLQPLWCDAGAGCAQGRGPYKVGGRFLDVLRADGVPRPGIGFHDRVTRTEF